jgi:hypothetical protein
MQIKEEFVVEPSFPGVSTSRGIERPMRVNPKLVRLLNEHADIVATGILLRM